MGDAHIAAAEVLHLIEALRNQGHTESAILKAVVARLSEIQRASKSGWY